MESDVKYKTPNFCPTCNMMVETGVIFDYSYDVQYKDELQCEGTAVVLSKCLNCGRPILTEEVFVEIEDRTYPQGKIQLYPITDNEALKNAPEIVTRPYKEAAKCYRSQAYDACVIMCRKGIEAICIDKAQTKGSLVQQLKSLKDQQVLDDKLYSWANELRLIGNDGAHSHNQVVTKADAKDSLDFFDAIVTYLYHLVHQYDLLKARRSKG